MNKIINKVKEDKLIKLIVEFSWRYNSNAKIYLVGGVIRDFYLGKESFDKDIVVENVDAEKFSKELAEFLSATFITLDDENKIYRLVLEDKLNYIDVACIVGNNIEDDLKRRDLTINSIALDLKTLKVIDLNHGVDDLEDKKIRHICEQNFIDDPLRLLRVYRFKALLNFDIDDELTNIVSKHVGKIINSAAERINYEFLKLFSGNYSAIALEEMDKTGLLKEILPISQELKKVPMNLHHHLGLFEHSIEVVNQIQAIYNESSNEVKKHLDNIDFGGMSRLTHLKLSGLLHDIGKPQTWTIEEGTEKHRFIKHDDIGSKMSLKILKSLKFSKKQIEYVAKMIKYHIYPSHVVSSPDLNDKISMRFVRKMENESIDIIVLAMADRFAARGVEITEEVINKNINGLKTLLNFYLSIKDTLEPLPKLLSGEEIMEILNIKPSIELGAIIKSLKEAQLSGEVNTKEDAVNFVINR